MINILRPQLGRRKDMEDRERDLDRSQTEEQEDPVFKAEEIIIEEMAIDGICGVY